MPGSEAALRRYLEELYRWNPRVNLTAVPRDEAEHRHIDESRRLLAAADAGSAGTIVDIGSGGGVPGLVIAVLRPDLAVTLVEADRRKAGFLTHAAAVCGCRNVTVLAVRAEAAGRDPAQRERHQIAVSRATAPAAVLCELALPFLCLGGRLLALVADAVADAGRAGFAASACGGSPPVALAADILAVTKVTATAELYPRRSGVPARRPLAAPT